MQIQVLSPQYYPQFINTIPQIHEMNVSYIPYLPPLKPVETNKSSKQILTNTIPQTVSSSDSESEMEKDLRERNRIAAQKWRQKKEVYLGDLEHKNDQLRQQALQLCNTALALKVQNQVLENELQFFQNFLSKAITTQDI